MASPNPCSLEAKEGSDRRVWGANPRGPLLQRREPGGGWAVAETFQPSWCPPWTYVSSENKAQA